MLVVFSLKCKWGQMGSGAVKTSNEVRKVFPVYQFPIWLAKAFWFDQVSQSLGDVRPVRAETIFRSADLSSTHWPIWFSIYCHLVDWKQFTTHEVYKLIMDVLLRAHVCKLHFFDVMKSWIQLILDNTFIQELLGG